MLLNPKAAIRPPGSPHRFGSASEVVGVIEEALRVLAASSSPWLLGEVANSLGGRFPALTERMERLLRYGDVEGTYAYPNGEPDRSKVAQALALAFLNAGLSQADFLQEMLDPTNQGGARIQEEGAKGSLAASSFAASCWAKAKWRAVQSPLIVKRADALDRIESVRAAVDRWDWKRMAGGTDRAVILAYIAIARETGKIAPDVADREVAERANVSRETITKRARPRLIEAGFLRHVPRPRGRTDAKTWELAIPPGLGVPVTTPSHTPLGVDMCGGDHAHDVWSWGGLGKSKQRIWDLLGQRERWPFDDLAEAYRASKATVRRHLRVLDSHGLAAKTDDGLWKRGDSDLDRVAEEIGATGKGERRRARHQLERRAYHQRLAGGPIPVQGVGLVDPLTGEVAEDISQREPAGPPAVSVWIRKRIEEGGDRFAIARELTGSGFRSPSGSRLWNALDVAVCDPTFELKGGDGYLTRLGIPRERWGPFRSRREHARMTT